ncbi:MAG TPA: cytochrome c peroxidase [Fibrobacteria bacterium]|jgi:cytochrome c peroxidase|nr:cytochrome c peroxidase [Fibrobacteria bacterium]
MPSVSTVFRYPLVRRLSVAFGMTLVLAGCLATNDADPHRVFVDGDYVPHAPEALAGWPAPLFPTDNPFTPEKAILGRRLFFSFELSRDRTVSCAWCHSPLAAFSDNHRGSLSTGVREQSTVRNTPSLGNMVFGSVFMFDGRAQSLESQTLLPLFAVNEMDMTGPEIVARLGADSLFVRLFRQAYGKGAITLEGVTRALATYERTLVSRDAPYDRWMAGDEGAMSPGAKRGAAIFLGPKGGCFRCHLPPLFTDGSFQDNGLDSIALDSGRGKITGLASDMGKFKVPTLRNVEVTAPYMHDGRFVTLDDVVRHYNSGGHPSPNVSTFMQPLGLTDGELSDLVEFLQSLTDPVFLESPRL